MKIVLTTNEMEKILIAEVRRRLGDALGNATTRWAHDEDMNWEGTFEIEEVPSDGR